MAFARSACLVSFTAALTFSLACGGRRIDDEDNKVIEDAATPLACGKPGAVCKGDDWCSYATVGLCGNDGKGGSCRARPTSCTDTCIGLCGCDGRVYCSTCEAYKNGTDVATGSACYPAGDYTAYALVTDVPRFVVFKADPARNVCVRLIFNGAGSGTTTDYKVSRGQWQLETAEITNRADDCVITTAGTPRTPTGDVLRATSAQGVLELAGNLVAPCGLSAKIFLRFDPKGFFWAPDSEPLAPTNVVIGGQSGCK